MPARIHWYRGIGVLRQGDIRWQGDIYVHMYKCFGSFQEEEPSLPSSSPRAEHFLRPPSCELPNFLTVNVVSSVSIGHFGRSLAESVELPDRYSSTRLYLLRLSLLLLWTSLEQCLPLPGSLFLTALLQILVQEKLMAFLRSKQALAWNLTLISPSWIGNR